jgi:hypothetical protein
MISFLLRVFAAVVLVLLAAAWVIHSKSFQWQCGAVAAWFVAALLENEGPAVPWSRKATA